MKKGEWVPMTFEAIEPAIKGKAELRSKIQICMQMYLYMLMKHLYYWVEHQQTVQKTLKSHHSIKQFSLHIQTMTDMVTSMVILQDLSKTIMILVH